MKVVKISDGSVVGVFNPQNAEQEIVALGYAVDECEFIKSQAEKDRENLIYLEKTDWLVTRHRDQVDLKVDTSMTDAEYQTLLQKRQATRVEIVDQEALVKYRSVMNG